MFYADVIQKDPRFTSTKRISDLALLEPITRAAVETIISQAAKLGITIEPFETFRSEARQQLLFQQKATKLRQVGVHHYGLACDLVKIVDGEPSWKGDYTFLRNLAYANNLISGQDWGNPKIHHSFIDADHVQRVGLPRQADLFAGRWYPDDAYNPYTDH